MKLVSIVQETVSGEHHQCKTAAGHFTALENHRLTPPIFLAVLPNLGVADI